MDGDHLVTVADAIIVLQIVSGNFPGDIQLALITGDMDGNKKLGVEDAVCILQKAAGLK